MIFSGHHLYVFADIIYQNRRASMIDQNNQRLNPVSIEFTADAAVDLLSAARTLQEQVTGMITAAQILVDKIARGKPVFPDDLGYGHAQPPTQQPEQPPTRI